MAHRTTNHKWICLQPLQQPVTSSCSYSFYYLIIVVIIEWKIISRLGNNSIAGISIYRDLLIISMQRYLLK